MGLRIMKSRAELIGGTLRINPNNPSGTIVSCEVNVERYTHSRPSPNSRVTRGHLVSARLETAIALKENKNQALNLNCLVQI
jgi:hypothetical protein